MKKVLSILAAVVLISSISCKDEKKEAAKGTNQQMKKVMAIHDEVMPKMSAMGSMVGELSSKEDSTELGLQYKAARRGLQDAHKAMMDWMQGFSNRFEPDEILNGKALTAQKQIWLDEEEEKVKALREQIYNSIEQAEKLLERNKELQTENHLKLSGAEGKGFRLNGGKPIETDKASTIEKLRGCATIKADPTMINKKKIIYLQFLGPNKAIIEDNGSTITAHGNVYSKKVELVFTGAESQICDFITIPKESLKAGKYILNVFENEQLLDSAEFQLQ
ncbi:MAG: hypothetical protein KJO63_15760 [Maribacter sp.]|nr:hypothetical protein [Maribacter sp.]